MIGAYAIVCVMWVTPYAYLDVVLDNALLVPTSSSVEPFS